MGTLDFANVPQVVAGFFNYANGSAVDNATVRVHVNVSLAGGAICDCITKTQMPPDNGQIITESNGGFAKSFDAAPLEFELHHQHSLQVPP